MKGEFLHDLGGKPTIEQIRVRLRIKKADLYKKAGISNNAYYNIVKKSKPVRPETVGAVLDALTDYLREKGEFGDRERLEFEDLEGIWLNTL
jgi:DNA-binding Xre family transcriptional regulator